MGSVYQGLAGWEVEAAVVTTDGRRPSLIAHYLDSVKSRSTKIYLVVIGFVLTTAIVGWFGFLFFVESAFGTKYQPHSSWNIDEYKIIQRLTMTYNDLLGVLL